MITNTRLYKLYRRFFLNIYNLFLRLRLAHREDFTLLSNNCLAGVIYHDLNRMFCSPTINLWMSQEDYLRFCLYLDDFLDGYLEPLHMEFGYPYMALISKENRKVSIGFMHYKSYEDASTKWYIRVKRMKKNTIIIFEYKEKVDSALLNDFLNLPQKKIIYCSKNLLNIPSVTFDPGIYDENYTNSKICFASEGIWPKKYYQRFNIVRLIKQ